MHVIVVGSGVIGLSSAWFLRRQGYKVTVVDRAAGPGLETSYANGSLLTPSMADPWNSPGCWKELLRSVGRNDSALQLRLKAVPSLLSWGCRFLAASRPADFKRNTRANLLLALHSLDAMKRIRADTDLEYGRQTRGSLRIFREAAQLDHAGQAGRLLAECGVGFRILTPSEATALEPGLLPLEKQLVGAIHYPLDEVGNARSFCFALEKSLRLVGCVVRFDAPVARLETQKGRVTGVIIRDERLTADAVVIAAASHSPTLLKSAGLNLPIQPAKGYSLTIDCDGICPLGMPVIDDALHAAIVPLDRQIRVAGTAEFTGYDLRPDPSRIDNLRRLVAQVLPEAHLPIENAESWCGLRAMSADGVAIIGETPITNLWINSGHGHLGWTMAAGSGDLIAQLIAGQSPALDPRPYAPRRFRSLA